MRCFIIWEHIIVVFSFDALFGLTWRMLTPCLSLTSCLKPLWSFVFWLVIPLYALVNNVLSLCMIMVIIALLVGRSQSFASLHLYWEGILLVHPTPKKQNFPMCPLIRLKRIYNFWCSMLVLHHLLHVLFTLRGVFMWFTELTYWQDATVPVPCFQLVLCFRKAT
jgi:hypothetical protein